ncbi:MAG: hypothetical protein DIU79_15825 [Actinobacteria bacterium]|nr:MAG: hypothetical protein DIU79_15825 [Actinomycetota bacterium]
MSVTILRADARHLPLPDESVDLIVTSPPYYALRSYSDGGEHYAGQIGDEPTPAEYIANLIDCTREWTRVLKPTGSIFVNLGDSYAGQTPGRQGCSGARSDRRSANEPYRAAARRGDTAPRKSLRGLPWRYAIGCIDQLGLILRAEIIWSKPNPVPENIADRVRRSHEYWFHFVRQPRYYAAVDEIREPLAAPFRPPGSKGRPHRNDYGQPTNGEYRPLGRLPGSVWEIATEPLRVPEHLGIDHFAAFPTEWPRRIILGWSPPSICVECGEGRRPVVKKAASGERRDSTSSWNVGYAHFRTGHREFDRLRDIGISYTITGYACACPEPTAPVRRAVVLDPFGGTGTTALVAHALGRHGISVDRSADYCRLAQWRTSDPGQIAKAMRVPPPPKPLQGQLDLLGGAA